MSRFVHLHVHSQYSILDGQASIHNLVDKAVADGQPGIALTDHGSMFGIKEFYNYVKKINDKKHDKIKSLRKLFDAQETLLAECSDPKSHVEKLRQELNELEAHKTESVDAAEQYAKLKERTDEVAQMEKEFGFDAAVGRKKSLISKPFPISSPSSVARSM